MQIMLLTIIHDNILQLTANCMSLYSGINVESHVSMAEAIICLTHDHMITMPMR